MIGWAITFILAARHVAHLRCFRAIHACIANLDAVELSGFAHAVFSTQIRMM
jgi:hypothetical protein